MKKLLLILTLTLAGCTSYSTYYVPTTEVIIRLKAADRNLMGDIAELDANIRQMRDEVIFLVQQQLIDDATLNGVRTHLLAADYFAAKAWIGLIEKSKDTRALYDIGKDEFKRAVDITVTAINKKNSL